MDAPPAPIGVGDEFTSTGADPMGGFVDRSVVTEATPSSAFEFVTEATLTTKKGAASVWTNVHRYELQPTARLSHRLHAPGHPHQRPAWPAADLQLARAVVMGVRAASGVARKGIANLASLAEERVIA